MKEKKQKTPENFQDFVKIETPRHMARAERFNQQKISLFQISIPNGGWHC